MAKDKEKKISNLSIISSPILTEKAFRFFEKGQYCFFVKAGISKKVIKLILEILFFKKIKSLQTLRAPFKKRHRGVSQFKKSYYKKVYATFEPVAAL